MNSKPDMVNFEMAVVIVNFGVGSKILKIAEKNDIYTGTVFLGMGTLKNRILEFLQLADVRKEVVILAAEKTRLIETLDIIDKELELKKPYHGIAYTMALPVYTIGNSKYVYEKSEDETAMYNVITVIVDRGRAETAMDIATAAGARGGTIVKARGTGEYQTGKLFHMDIEPEKEILLILSEISASEKIAKAIYEGMELEKDGNGILFCQDVNSVYGIS